jgi:cAMP phosphodiesterase
MDTDREKFRSYVQKSGIMSALTNILVKLYEQPLKPDDPLGFIRRELEKNSDEADKIKTLETKVTFFL